MGVERRGEWLAEQDVPVLRPLALVDEDLGIVNMMEG
jgi:hypothetical protein